MRLLLPLLPLLLLVPGRPGAAAADEPTSGELVLAGSGMAIPTYFAGVAIHEGSHAVAVEAMGGDVTEFQVLPGFSGGHFYFGRIRWRGDLSRGEKALVLLSPKITNLLVMGGYALLVSLDGLPSNEYGQLALAVVATGHWIDFTKSAVTWSVTDDVRRAGILLGWSSEWERLPARLVQLGLAAGAAYFLVRGYLDVFDDPQAPPAAFIVPLAGFTL